MSVNGRWDLIRRLKVNKPNVKENSVLFKQYDADQRGGAF